MATSEGRPMYAVWKRHGDESQKIVLPVVLWDMQGTRAVAMVYPGHGGELLAFTHHWPPGYGFVGLTFEEDPSGE